MTNAIDSANQQSLGLRQFKEFIFVGKTSANSLEQLNNSPNSNCLSAVTIRKDVLITQLYTTANITNQLQNLQLKPGKKVQLVSKTDNGSIVVSFDGKLVGIGAAIAQKIIVKLAD